MAMPSFAGIENAKAGKGGVYFEPGNYFVEILAAKSGFTFMKRPFFVVETKILESDNPNRKAGSECSHMIMLDQPSGLGNVKGFVAASHPCNEEDVDEAGVNHVVSDKQPYKGKRMRVQAVNITTREGKPFTKCIWRQDAKA